MKSDGYYDVLSAVTGSTKHYSNTALITPGHLDVFYKGGPRT
jgi:hypothetical protein